jgi:phosphate starvation-inducible protein PhoH
LQEFERIAIIYLNEKDIVRHPLVQRILQAYGDERGRSGGKRKE